MKTYKDFNWRKDKLFLGNKDTGFGLAYKVKYPDKVLSEDYYNISRAKDHAVKEATSHFNRAEAASEKPLDALK